jgi:hypothetical protein
MTFARSGRTLQNKRFFFQQISDYLFLRAGQIVRLLGAIGERGDSLRGAFS